MRSRFPTLGVLTALLGACAQAPLLTAAGDDVTMHATVAAPQRHTLALVPVNGAAGTIDHTDALLYSVVNGVESLYAQATLSGDPTGKVISFAHLHHSASYRLQLRAYSDAGGNDQISMDASSTKSFTTTTADDLTVGSTPLVMTDVGFSASGVSNGVSILDGAFRHMGVVTSLAGDGAAGAFLYPQGVAVDPVSGAVYVSDSYNRRIVKVMPDGSSSQFYSGDIVEGLVVDRAGNVYVVDRENNTILKLDPTGMQIDQIGTGTASHQDGPTAIATFHDPTRLALDALGNLYVSDLNNNCIRKVTPDGMVSTLAGDGNYGNMDDPHSDHGATAEFANQRGIAVDANGNVYVADSDNGTIRKVAPDGTTTTQVPQHLTLSDGTPFSFSLPRGLAIDAHGELYVADQDSHVIIGIAPDGSASIVAGASGSFGVTDDVTGDRGASARFNEPVDVAVGPDGALYVIEVSNTRLRRIL